MMRVTTAHRTSPGGRAVNEDYFGVAGRGTWNCWVVADGLGGHVAGEEASLQAVEAILAAARTRHGACDERLREYVLAAQAAVVAAQQDAALATMRTTVVVLARDGDRMAWAHVGDSRLYYFRDDAILHQTCDHSVPQMLVAVGGITADQIRHHADRGRLLLAIGSETPPAPALLAEPLQIRSGDAVLLCTDGWWEYVTETEMLNDLAGSTTPEQWLAAMAARIEEAATGRHDNYTAVAVFIEDGEL